MKGGKYLDELGHWDGKRRREVKARELGLIGNEGAADE
jgi:hypothetical protein